MAENKSITGNDDPVQEENPGDDFEMPLRPNSIYLVTLWSLLRAILPPLSIIGQYRIYYELYGVDRSQNLITTWLNFFSPLDKTITLGLALQGIVFLLSAIGVFLGLGWGRKTFIWASVLLLVGDLIRGILTARFGFAFYDLISLCLASWYFRQPNVLAYFGVEDDLPHWVRNRVGKLPFDLAIALAAGILVILVEVIGVFQNFS